MQQKRTPFCRTIRLGLMIVSFSVCSVAVSKEGISSESAITTVKTAVSETAVPAEPATPPVPPMNKTQVPGFYRIMVGQFEVTALFDGVFEFHPELLKNADRPVIEKALTHHYGKTSGIQTTVNAYLIHTGEHLVLVDAGAGKLFSEGGQGRVVANLKASGYEPEQVDMVVMTHLHGDHTGGLSDKEGNLLFPNATVYADKAENEYWLSEQQAAAAPVERQVFFKMARESAVPYLSAEKWKTLEPGQEIVPGIRAVAAYGHTPGHTAFEVTSDGQTLLIWGDIVHSHAIQFNRPEVAIEYDSDATQAVKTRQALLNSVAKKNELVAGMHLPFPGLGYIRAEGNGKYRWIPVEYSPLD